MSTTKKQLIVKPEFNDFLQAVDEIRNRSRCDPPDLRQAPTVNRGKFRKDGGTLQRHDDKSSDGSSRSLARAQLAAEYKEAEETCGSSEKTRR